MTIKSNPLIQEMQLALKYNRLYHGRLNGVPSPEFDDGVSKFKAAVGFVKRPYFTEQTLKKMDVPENLMEHHPAPWMNELSRYLGMHEVTHREALMAWLRSDGKTLGDPSKLPWCGDAVETAIKLTLPLLWELNMSAALNSNPYWAMNWLGFGIEDKQVHYGAIAVFSRPGGGHVGFVAGYDSDRGKVLIRGGNQSNKVSDVWMSTNAGGIKLLGMRWPHWQDRLPWGENKRVLAPRLDSRNNTVETKLT